MAQLVQTYNTIDSKILGLDQLVVQMVQPTGPKRDFARKSSWTRLIQVSSDDTKTVYLMCGTELPLFILNRFPPRSLPYH